MYPRSAVVVIIPRQEQKEKGEIKKDAFGTLDTVCVDLYNIAIYCLTFRILEKESGRHFPSCAGNGCALSHI